MVTSEVWEVASTVVPSRVEGLAVASAASLLASLAFVVDFRVCTHVCLHRMNASALENVSSDRATHDHVHGASGAFGIPPLRDMPLPLRPTPCLSCAVDACG